ncbi:MAG: AMP-binding protein, partial [Dehalococcoidia bacterium]|nr:AMP-binding protein [Dehalococcoidia bacterium]
MLSSILDGKPDGAAAVVVPGGPAVTYGELQSSVDRAAGLLAGAGLEPERPVAIALGNGLEFLIAFLAVTRAGAVAAPLNPAYTADEFAYYVGDAESQIAVVPPGSHPAREAAD